MSATRAQARDECAALITAALPGLPIYWDDLPGNSPDAEGPDTQPWARWVMRHDTGNQASLGRNGGKQRWDRTGTIFIQLFALPGDGLSALDALTKTVVDAYEGKSTTPGHVWFRNVTAREIGTANGWTQVNVVIDFTYTEIK